LFFLEGNFLDDKAANLWLNFACLCRFAFKMVSFSRI
jgi:hypothetical protein